MAQPAATLKHKTYAGSPGSGTKEGGPTDVYDNDYNKSKAMYCGVSDSRPDSENPKQSAD